MMNKIIVKGIHKIQTNQFVFYKIPEKCLTLEVIERATLNKPIPVEIIEPIISPFMEIIDDVILNDYIWKIEL